MKIKLLVLLICVVITLPCVSTAEQSSGYQSLPALSEQIAAKIKAESEQTAGIIKAESEQTAAKFKALSEQTTDLSENMAVRIRSASSNTARDFKSLLDNTARDFMSLSDNMARDFKSLSDNTVRDFKSLSDNTALQIKEASAQSFAQIQKYSEQRASEIQKYSAQRAMEIQKYSEQRANEIRKNSEQRATEIQKDSEQKIAEIKSESVSTTDKVSWFKAWTEKWILKIGDWVFPTPSTKQKDAPNDGMITLQNQVFTPNSVPEPTRPLAVLNSLQWNTWFLEAATGTDAPSIPDNWAVNHVGQMNALDNELTKLRDKLGDNPNINPDNFPQYEEIIHRYTTRYP